LGSQNDFNLVISACSTHVHNVDLLLCGLSFAALTNCPRSYNDVHIS